MRNRFDEQLSELNSMLIEMGALVERSIMLATEALANSNTTLAKQVAELDQDVDRKEKEIESLCLRLLLQQQPVASDLRLISAALKMITDLERIADQAADICEITLMLAMNAGSFDTDYRSRLQFTEMAQVTAGMVTMSIDAFVRRDIGLARTVIGQDDTVDELFDLIKFELIGLIQTDGNNGEQAIDLIMIAKYFERIGDHAVNIAEWVVFSITGEHVSLQEDKSA